MAPDIKREQEAVRVNHIPISRHYHRGLSDITITRTHFECTNALTQLQDEVVAFFEMVDILRYQRRMCSPPIRVAAYTALLRIGGKETGKGCNLLPIFYGISRVYIH